MTFSVLPLSLLGFRVAGDIGGITYYTNKKYKKVAYKKAPPDKPPSPLQILQRTRFQTAVRAWIALSPDDKAALERAVHKTSLCLTGQNLFTSCSLRHAPDVYNTIALQTREVLPPLIFIP